MAFIPYDVFSFKTKLDYNEIKERIQNLTEPKKIIRLIKGNSKKAYEGKVQENNFTINRIVTFTNVFSPNIYGTMAKEDDGIKIDLKFKLHTMAIIVMIIWLGVVGYVFINSLMDFIANNVSNKDLSTSVLILVGGYIIMTLAFKTECKKDKIMLEELFELTQS